MSERSIWKKEISFRRKRKVTISWEKREPTVEAPAAVSAAAVPAAKPEVSFWKREITLGRRKPVEAAQASEPAPAAPAPVPTTAAPTPATPAAPVRETETAQPAQPTTWQSAIELAAYQTEPSASVVADREETVETVPVLPAVEPAPARPDPEPAPLPEAPKVAAAAKADVPFWKREVVIGRRPAPKDTAPEAPVETQVHAEPAVSEPDLDETFETWPAPPTIETAATVPVAEGVPEVEPPAVPAPAGPKEPSFWKRDIGRKSSSPKVSREKRERGARGAKRLVGLKIGASQLSAARVSNNGVAELLQVAREPLSPGIVAGGEVRDSDALSEALKSFFAKHKLPKRGVRLGIANNRIGVRTFEVAGIEDPKQLENAVRFRAQESLPIPIDEAVLDFHVISERTDESGRIIRRVLLVVAYREQINRWIEACKKAGIPLVGIDLEAFALLRALQAPQEGAGLDPTAALVAVAIGHERSTLAVSDGTTCEFTRVLEWGGSALNIALARALHSAPSEVEAIKRSLSLADEVTPEGLTPEQAVLARDALRGAIQSFARELVSSLHFYQNQPGSLGLGEIVLTGGTAHLPGLAPELEQLTGVHVRVGDPLARMKVSKRVKEPEQLGSLSVAIGLGIED